jgi:hypothetical protein
LHQDQDALTIAINSRNATKIHDKFSVRVRLPQFLPVDAYVELQNIVERSVILSSGETL